MTLEELTSQLLFAQSAIEKKTDSPIKVKPIITVSKQKIVASIKEIGFDDKSATIYIEIE